MLLAQVKANFSSSDDISSAGEAQEDGLDSGDNTEIGRSTEDNGTDQNGKYVFKMMCTSVFHSCVCSRDSSP